MDIYQGVFQLVTLGVVALLFKFLLSSLGDHLKRVEESWERYTDKLTTSINEVHSKLDASKELLSSDIKDIKYELNEVKDEVSEIRTHLGGLVDGKVSG